MTGGPNDEDLLCTNEISMMKMIFFSITGGGEITSNWDPDDPLFVSQVANRAHLEGIPYAYSDP